MRVDRPARIELRGVTIRYPPRTLLDGFDADLEPGMTALLGPSGTGKTTLLALIAGFEAPEAGIVTVPDHLRGPVGIGAGWIMQTPAVLAHRTAVDNVALALLAMGRTRTEARSTALRALADVGLAEAATTVAGHLSGGERQRVAVARALAADAPVILADEPTASLGPEHRRLVVDHLEAIARRGRVVVVATHDPWVASRCSRVIDLRRG